MFYEFWDEDTEALKNLQKETLDRESRTVEIRRATSVGEDEESAKFGISIRKNPKCKRNRWTAKPSGLEENPILSDAPPTLESRLGYLAKFLYSIPSLHFHPICRATWDNKCFLYHLDTINPRCATPGVSRKQPNTVVPPHVVSRLSMSPQKSTTTHVYDNPTMPPQSPKLQALRTRLIVSANAVYAAAPITRKTDIMTGSKGSWDWVVSAPRNLGLALFAIGSASFSMLPPVRVPPALRGRAVSESVPAQGGMGMSAADGAERMSAADGSATGPNARTTAKMRK